MNSALLLGGILLVAAILYALTGGADYGGGVWDLLASDERKKAQRALIEKTIGPIWEANHVWLILVVVILFAGFPPAFAKISIALHIPLTALLVGIVARGTAFMFRAYDRRDGVVDRRWGLVFSIASVATPLVLGVIIGALASGEIRVVHGEVQSGFFTPWADHGFPWIVGLFTLSLFAHLAAVYLTVEAKTRDLADDFRRRALITAGTTAALGILTLSDAYFEAPEFLDRMLTTVFSLVAFGATALLAGLSCFALLTRNYRFARIFVAGEGALIIAGWGAAMAPSFWIGGPSLSELAAPADVQWAMILTLCVGAPILGTALIYLFRVFQRRA